MANVSPEQESYCLILLQLPLIPDFLTECFLLYTQVILAHPPVA